jgi:hypothetical protein
LRQFAPPACRCGAPTAIRCRTYSTEGLAPQSLIEPVSGSTMIAEATFGLTAALRPGPSSRWVLPNSRTRSKRLDQKARVRRDVWRPPWGAQSRDLETRACVVARSLIGDRSRRTGYRDDRFTSRARGARVIPVPRMQSPARAWTARSQWRRCDDRTGPLCAGSAAGLRSGRRVASWAWSSAGRTVDNSPGLPSAPLRSGADRAATSFRDRGHGESSHRPSE